MVERFSIFISFLTLIIFIYQTNVMREQSLSSILPYLMISTSDDPGSDSFTLRIDNHGVGPAIIESVEFEYKESQYDLQDFDNYFFNFMRAMSPGLDSLERYSASSLDRGLAIPAGTAYDILSVKNAPKDYNLLRSEIQNPSIFRFKV